MEQRNVLGATANVQAVETGIAEDARRRLVDGLSHALADAYTLYLKTQGCHWNVVGPLFYGLHKLTEEQYEDLAEAVDEIAERIRSLGYPAPATFSQFAALSSIDGEADFGSAETMIRHLMADHEALSRHLRATAEAADQAEDQVSADLLTDRLRAHEKAVWMLRAILA